MNLLLDRSDYEDDSTLGDLFVDGVHECLTLELGLATNDVKVAGKTCIPEGTYQVLITQSPRFQRRLPLLVGVPGFDGIRIHPGNTTKDSTGCILVGQSYTTQDGVPFLLRSADAFNALFAKMDAAIQDGQQLQIEVRP